MSYSLNLEPDPYCLTVRQKKTGKPHLRNVFYAILSVILTVAVCGRSDTIVNAKTNKNVEFAAELARIDDNLARNKALAIHRPSSWINHQGVAEAYAVRAKLTGDFNDYLQAQQALAKAFSLTRDGTGPVLSRAALNFSLHRLPEVEADLVMAESAILVSNATRARINGLRADVLFQTGRYHEALRSYHSLEALAPDVTSAARLAMYYAHTGEHQQSELWLAKSEARVSGKSLHLRSWLKLQFGIMDLERGRWDEALAHYQEGLNIFPGFWLIEEHIAEIDALQGRTNQAESSYRDLINRTGSPMFMVALSDILQEGDRTAVREASTWRHRADRYFQAMLTKLPEAASGHALEYFVQTGDSGYALQLAQNNYRLRPGGQAALLLAQAYSINGQLPKAVQLLDKILATPYRSATLHATAHIVFLVTGQHQKANKQDARARSINPYAIEETGWLRDRLNSTEGRSRTADQTVQN